MVGLRHFVTAHRVPGRIGRLLAVGVLAAALVGCDSGAVQVDRTPVTAGAAWLSGQLTKGVMHNDQYDFDDYGLSLDTETALAAVGGHRAAVRRIAHAVARGVGSYIGNASGSEQYAGSIAKALVGAETAGLDPRHFGGVDLVTRLESLVGRHGVASGRVHDRVDPADPHDADYANVIGQALAAEGLARVHAAATAPVTRFLLEQQCSAGYFRLSFASAHTADQTCDGGMPAQSRPDPDVTALVVLALQPQRSEKKVTAATAEATGWLLAHQHRNGSFGAGPTQQAPNTNSTGLAGWALGVTGHRRAARRAAVWVRAHQAMDGPRCGSKLTGDRGAIAYDTAALTAGRANGIGRTAADQWRRAATQALPVLRWAPAASGSLALARGAGGRSVRVSGLAPGEGFCLTSGARNARGVAGAAGRATVQVPGSARRVTIFESTGKQHQSLELRGS